MQTSGHPREHRRQPGREAGVPAHDDHHAGPAAQEGAGGAHAGPGQTGDRARVVPPGGRAHAASQPSTMEERVGELEGRPGPGLLPAVRAVELDRLGRVPAVDQRTRDLERGDDVTARPATGDHCAARCDHRPRAVPMVLRPEPATRSVVAASPWRATLIRMPAAAMVITSDEPPKEMNGSGNAGDGQHAHHRPDVDEGLRSDPGHYPEREQSAEAVPRLHRRPDAEPHEPDEQGEHEHGADDPELLADDREDEVGLRVRAGNPTGPGRRRCRNRPRGPTPAR